MKDSNIHIAAILATWAIIISSLIANKFITPQEYDKLFDITVGSIAGVLVYWIMLVTTRRD